MRSHDKFDADIANLLLHSVLFIIIYTEVKH